jgi:hypothetical protein
MFRSLLFITSLVLATAAAELHAALFDPLKRVRLLPHIQYRFHST